MDKINMHSQVFWFSCIAYQFSDIMRDKNKYIQDCELITWVTGIKKFVLCIELETIKGMLEFMLRRPRGGSSHPLDPTEN